MNISVQYRKRTWNLNLIVTADNGLALIWEQLAGATALINGKISNGLLNLQSLLAKHLAVFKDEPGIIILFKAKLHNAKPGLCKP